MHIDVGQDVAKSKTPVVNLGVGHIESKKEDEDNDRFNMTRSKRHQEGPLMD